MYDIHFNWHTIIKLHACTYKYNSFYQKVRVQRTDYPRGIMFPFFLPKHHLHSNPDTNKYFSLIHVHKSKTICMLSISIYSYLPYRANVRDKCTVLQKQICLPSKNSMLVSSSKLCMCLPDSVVSFCFSLLCSGPFYAAPPAYAHHLFQKSNFHRTCQQCGIPTNIFDTFI